MLFSDSERRELAAFFAKRFTDPTVRAMLAKRAGVPDTGEASDTSLNAWDDLIDQAQMRRKLEKLATLAAKTDQSDHNLQAVCNLLGARARTARHRAAATGVAAVLALSFGVGGWLLGSGSESPVAITGEHVASAELALADTVLPTPSSEVAADMSEPPSMQGNLPTATPPSTAPEPEEIESPNRKGKKARKKTGPAYRNGRCTYDLIGDFIGYWYAGREAPGAVGEVIDVEMGLNVRSKYPHGKNGFNKRAPVRCILKRGDKVKLSAAPIQVPGDHYWVPLHHGDIVEEAAEELLVATR